MKFIILTIVLALPLGYLFGEEEYVSHSTTEAISKAPGFAPAVLDKVIRTDSKKHTSYRVRFRYEVNGQQYRTTTTSTDQQGALAYAAQTDMQVAYSTRDPSISMIKRYYDLRHTRGTLSQSLIVTSLLSLALALPIALGISWRLGWLRRKQRK